MGVRLQEGYVKVLKVSGCNTLRCVIPYKVARDLNIHEGDVLIIRTDGYYDDRAEIIKR